MVVVQTTLDSDPDGFFRNALDGMERCADKWRAHGKVFAWIDQQPTWISAADWTDYGCDGGFPPDPTAPCRRRLRFSLIGGGQVRVTEIWEIRPDEFGCGGLPDLGCIRDKELFITAHGESRRHVGYLSHGAIAEMATRAVVFPRRTPQTIADRTAATLRAIDNTPRNFFALLDGSKGCAFCGRLLRDPVSKLIGVGPDCARDNNIPHSLAAANRRLELRRELLGDPS
jgi:Family of unknown function (DUF6011)